MTLCRYYQDKNNPPFKENELVVCCDALPGATVKNGLLYRVYSVHFHQANDGEWYWYCGVAVGDKIVTHNWLRPSIFRSLTEAEKQPLVLEITIWQ